MAVAEPKVDFNNVPSRFWTSIGFSVVCINLNSDIWIFAKSGINQSIVLNTNQVVIIKVVFCGEELLFGFVHGHCRYVDRRQLWSDVQSLNAGNLMLVGDFNITLGAHERTGFGSHSRAAIQDFCTFLDNVTLGNYIWSTHRISSIRGRIDIEMVHTLKTSLIGLWQRMVLGTFGPNCMLLRELEQVQTIVLC